MKHLSLLAVVASFIFTGQMALGDNSENEASPRASAIANAKMDLQTHHALIEKLQTVLPHISPDSEQAITIKVRLADLFSERARLKDIAAGEKNCTNCKGAEKDRRQAIAFYLEGKKFISKNLSTLTRVNLQMANLYKLVREPMKMEAIYREILKDQRQVKIHSKAHLGIAEMLFEKGEYQKSSVEYQAALKRASAEDRAYIVFRQSWVAYNIGQNGVAVKMIQQAVRQAQSLSLASFHKDLMRDYATMLARNPFTPHDIETFLEYSPEADRMENLKFFGEEADRLGNKKGALLIWSMYLRQENPENDKADIQLKLAQNFYDLDNYPQALEHLDNTVGLIRKKKCNEENCESELKDFKSLLITWNKKEKISPSRNLSLAYQKYIVAHPDDFEVIVWAAQVARSRKDHLMAYELYEQAAIYAAKKNKKKELESSLVTGIEIAESSQNQKIYERALNKYLELNRKGPLAYTVRYQLAYLLYKNNKYKEAALAFKELATDREAKDKKLQLQSAELSLDSFKLIKDDLEIRQCSKIYAQLFPERSSHFNEIGRKVTINQLVLAVKAPTIDESLIRSELKILQSYPIGHLSSVDQGAHYRTLVLASEKIKDLTTIVSASQNLLKVKNLKQDDVNLAKKSLLWVFELRLEFKKAYQMANEMPLSHMNREQKSLKLGILAELAKMNPEKHFNDYLRSTKAVRSANQIRLKLIRLSSHRWSSYERMFKYLKSTPDLLAQIALENYLLDPRSKEIKKVLAIPGVRSTPEGIYLFNLESRKNYQDIIHQVKDLSLIAASDQVLQKKIKTRIQLLEKLKIEHGQAIQRGDLYLQALVLDSLVQEDNRFYRQLKNLPTPRGLSPKERETYHQLLDQRAQPFLLAAQEAKGLLENLFSLNSEILSKMKKAIGGDDLLARHVALYEFKNLQKFLPKSEISHFKSTIAEIEVNPSKIESARQKIEKNPLDINALENLRELESKRANGPMLAYLDERLSQLKTESRR